MGLASTMRAGRVTAVTYWRQTRVTLFLFLFASVLGASAAKKCSGQTGRVVVPQKSQLPFDNVPQNAIFPAFGSEEYVFDSIEEAKEKCCELCDFYRQPCTTFQVMLLEGDEKDYEGYELPVGKFACQLYRESPTIQECSASGCPATYTGSPYLNSSKLRSDNYVGTMTGKGPKCGYAVFPDERDYSFYGYRGYNGFAYKGFKSRGKLHKVAKNVRSIKSCFQRCVNDDDSECESFTYDAKAKRCRMNKGGYIMIRGEYEEFLSKFCESSDRYASGFVVDEYD